MLCPPLCWPGGQGREQQGPPGLSLDREGSCGTDFRGGRLGSGGRRGQPGGLRAALAPGWLPRALAPGWLLAGKGHVSAAVAFSWVMGHHDSFNFRNAISGREIARFGGKTQQSVLIPSRRVVTTVTGIYRRREAGNSSLHSERRLARAQAPPPRPAMTASAQLSPRSCRYLYPPRPQSCCCL